jgi:hypothetical protein
MPLPVDDAPHCERDKLGSKDAENEIEITPEIIEAAFEAFAEGGFACEHLYGDRVREMIVVVSRVLSRGRDKDHATAA